ncbi:Crp/Fnr family transcriptional regulator [Sphingosinicella sp. LHD-64]|uniref:Crp/Fnr family transcriptional regulator n=1 Tax=Sphingosinicella sp. LHD-64 TaxID=3072139 RepID=UPI00281086E1|nr:Crp/Fnr family transcriptional regulator [Sphingosinicella sp. LHD-64]MDQ8756823.1 Crp/Fnr family transcriptional regulator [Sphingosinicella sp. LHD-64]
MIDYLLRKLRARDEIADLEELALGRLAGEIRDYPADKTVIQEGEPLDFSSLLLEGMMCRYKDLRDGGRQISAIHVPGDFLDLHSFTLKRLDHNVMAMTRCKVVLVPHERLKAMTEEEPHLTRLFWFSTNLDAAMHREWELSLGRRSAIARVAHLFCELQARLEIVGLAEEAGYDFKFTQTEIAECVGLTSVHVNRVLRQLRERRLVEFRGGRVTMLDRAGLERIAEFRPAYLYLDRRPI